MSPWTNTNALPRILITGPESSGKTTLAKALAEALDGVFWPEYARGYLEERDGVYDRGDLDVMLRNQLNQFNQCTGTLEKTNIFDTGPETFHIWSQVKYGEVSPYIIEQIGQMRYDFSLLCVPDLAWEPDPLRETPNQQDRMSLFCTSAGLLKELGWRFAIIRGEDRLEMALRVLGLAGFSR